MRCTKAVIYKDNLEHNLKELRSFINPSVKICAAVKADGYGCGAVITAKIAEKYGIEYFAAATVDEAVELRKNKINSPIILLSVCSLSEFKEVIEYEIIPLVFDAEIIEILNKAAKKYGNRKKTKVFLAIDTGMGRIGCLPKYAVHYAKLICDSNSLELNGTITHFSVSDSISKEEQSITKKQFNLFQDAVASIKNAGINPGICSCSSSAAALSSPEMHLDMVRPGIAIYGYYPGEITQNYLKNIELYPVMQFESEISSIRRFKKGQSISYGRTWICKKETDIAVIPAGYADGILRRNSPGMEVSINGKLYPICGRICMDQCMVDIGINNPNVKRWDKVIFFGPKNKGALKDANDIALETNTISYEIMTSINKRVPRIIV